MAIATTLQHYLDEHHCRYDVVTHMHSRTSLETARSARVPESCLAKSVVLHDEQGYMLAVLPASRQLDLQAVCDLTGRRLRFAGENELRSLLKDCEMGAVPPVGRPYGLDTLIDDSVAAQTEIWMEAGDHEELIHMDSRAYLALMPEATRGNFSRPMQ